MKNKFRNPYEDRPVKKVGRLAQLSKRNRILKNQPIAGLRPSEQDWMYEKKRGVVSVLFQ